MDTITKLADGACPVSPTDVFTASSKTSVLAIDVSNPTGSPQSVTVLIHGFILFTVSIATLTTYSWRGPQVLESGHKLNIVAGSASCNYNVTGVIIT